jgi:sulfite exporter TauE/SafE
MAEGLIPMLGAVVAASLIGSLHCVGMCGGIVALCVGVEPERRGRWRLHALYHGGRFLTYAGLGAVSGGLGAAVDFGGAAVGLPRLAAGVAGATMIVGGALALARARGVHLGCVRLPHPVQRAFASGLRATGSLPDGTRSFAVGLITGALPCGWLYAFVLTAAGTGGALPGALLMAAFWLGTVPALLAVGIGVQGLAAPLRRHLPTLTASALLVIGAVTLVSRLGLPAYADETAALVRPTSLESDTTLEMVDRIGASVPACCNDDLH